MSSNLTYFFQSYIVCVKHFCFPERINANKGFVEDAPSVAGLPCWLEMIIAVFESI